MNTVLVYLLTLVGVAVAQKKDSSGLDSIQKVYNLRLSTTETFLIDLENLLQGSHNEYNIINDTKWDPKFDPAKHFVSKNWRELYSLPASNLTNECFFYNVPHFTIYSASWYIPERAFTGSRSIIVSRILNRRKDMFFLSTSYNSMYMPLPAESNEKFKTVNRLETLVFKYNSTHLNFVRADIKDIDQNQNTNFMNTYNHTHFEERCLLLQYIATLDEPVQLCFKTSNTDTHYDLVFRRPKRGKNLVLISFNKKDIRDDWEKTQMKIFPTQDGAFEVFVHYASSSSFWLFNFNADEVFGLQTYQIDFNISSIHYVASTLLIFNQIQLNSKIPSYTVRLLHRYPGSRFKFDDIIILAETMFINGYASNEDTEIILETARWPRYYWKGLMISATYSVYTYNLMKRSLQQVQGMGILMGCNLTAFGMPLKFDSFTVGETTMLLINLRFFNTTNTRTDDYVNITSNSRLGYWYTMNAYTGIGTTTIFNASYNLYNSDLIRDVSLNQYLMLPLMPLSDDNVNFKSCSVVKQRMNKAQLLINYKLTGSDEHYPYLNLSFSHKRYNGTSPFLINIEFFRPDEVYGKEYDIWETSNQTNFEVPMGQKAGSVQLRDIARGSFIVRILQYDRVADYTTIASNVRDSLERASMFNITSGVIANTVSMQIEAVDFMFALEASQEGKPSRMLTFLKKVGDPRTSVYEMTAGVNSFKGVMTLTDQIAKVLLLKPNLYFWFYKSGGFEMYNSVEATPTKLPYPGVNCLDVAVYYHWNVKLSLVCLDSNLNFVMYYLDELLARSLSNSQIRLEYKFSSAVTARSNIMTSEAYPGKIFVFTPKNSNEGKPQLVVFDTETEEKLEIFYVMSMDLVDPKEQKSTVLFRATAAYLKGDRIIVHFRANSGNNGLAVYILTETLTLKLIKYVLLPIEYHIDNQMQIFGFKVHFASIAHNNADSMLAIKIREGSPDGPTNVLMFDPSSSELDSFPTLVLPRSSSTEGVTIFPIYSYSESLYRCESVGLLHFKSSKDSLIMSNNNGAFYWLQYVNAGEPRIQFELTTRNLATYSDVFNSQNESRTIDMPVNLESHVLLGRQRLNSTFKKNVKLVQAAAGGVDANAVSAVNKTSEIKRVPGGKIMFSNHTNKFDGRNWTEIERRRFVGMFNKSILKWETKEESLFDQDLGTLRYSNPLAIAETISNLPQFKGLKKIFRFCRTYKLQNAKTDSKKATTDLNQECIKWGLVFLIESDIAIMYDSDIRNANNATLLRMKFPLDDCVDHFVMDYRLCTMCLIGSTKRFVQIDLITLSYDDNKMVSPHMPIKAHITDSTVMTINGLSFVRLSQSIRDTSHRRATGLNALSSYCKAGSPKFNAMDPDNNAHLLIVESTLITDISFNMFYAKKEDVFIMGDLVLTTGSQVGLMLKCANLKLVNRSDCSFLYFANHYSDQIQFTVSGTRESKQAAISNSRLRPLLFDEADSIIETKPDMFIYNNLSNKSDAILDFKSGSPMYSAHMLFMPNYHSYIIRYVNYFQRCNIAVYKMHNPFAGLENLFNNHRPECHRWACVFVLNFKIDYYLSLYDTEYEKIRAANRSNFDEIFNITVPCSERPPVDFHNLDAIPEAYTFYPLSVLQVKPVEVAFFDTTFSSAADPDELRLHVYHTDRSVSIVAVNRNFKIAVKNPYVSSQFVDVSVTQPFGRAQTLRFEFENFRESDFFKYWLLLGFLALLGVLYTLWARGCLRKEQNVTLQRVQGIDPLARELVAEEDTEMLGQNTEPARKIAQTEFIDKIEGEQEGFS